MTVHLDTSVLVDALTGSRRSLPGLERTIASGHVLGCSTLVMYEWLRGPRTEDERTHLEWLVPASYAHAFGTHEATAAADIYRRLKRARGRDMDIAIAACAVTHGAQLWTLNPADFADLPGLALYSVA
jgi:predicted nucleic acid-binding protein